MVIFIGPGPLATTRQGPIALVPVSSVPTTVRTVAETKVPAQWNHGPDAPPAAMALGFLLDDWAKSAWRGELRGYGC
jgi:hypothetical protein